MATNGRRIGKDAELEGAKKLNRLFLTGFHRSQQFKGNVDAHDLTDPDHPELAVEVKRRKQTNIHDAVEQVRNDATADQSPFVVHRKPGERWLLTVDLHDAPLLVARLFSIMAGGYENPCPNCDGKGAVAIGRDDGLVDCLDCNGSGALFNQDLRDIVNDAFNAAVARIELAEREGVDGRRLERQERKAKGGKK